MLHAHSFIQILIGGVLGSSLTGCSSNQVYAPTNSFEHEGIKFHRDSVIYSENGIIIPGNEADPIEQTWNLLTFFAGETPDIDAVERIAALRREMRNGTIARDYSWPMKDRSARWIIEAFQMYRINGDRQWLLTAFEASSTALDAQWTANYVNSTGLLRGETDITGLNEAAYPQWMRQPDKLSTIHLSTNALAIAALKATAAMADSLRIPNDRFIKRADSLSNAINRHLWMPKTGTYAQCLYSAPYYIPCNTVDITALLLTITSGAAIPDVARYMIAKLSTNGTELLKEVPKPPSIQWVNSHNANIGANDHPLLIYENGLCEQRLNTIQTHIEIPTDNKFSMVNIVSESVTGTTGYSQRPHKTIPPGTILEIEAENAGLSGTSLIRQQSMAKRFIELTPYKNSRLCFSVTKPKNSLCLMELIYTDGSSYQPWQLRNVTVNGTSAGMIAMPKLYNGPSTRGYSTPLLIELHEGTNHIAIETTPLLKPRGSILLDKIRLIHLN